jgi:hypothetical protein
MSTAAISEHCSEYLRRWCALPGPLPLVPREQTNAQAAGAGRIHPPVGKVLGSRQLADGSRASNQLI